MCLAIPVRIVELLGDDLALFDVGGIRKEISLALVDDVKVGDYVVAHTGYAIGKLDRDEAEKTLQLLASMAGEPAALAG
ncbi:HypC/HybG/HupF family hydrogenase formation chaperone [Rhodocyclus tenuis]|uniref:HypC/HybG/HupF family hydrogenase formation chaperone n=1 Tax=Rhodocyclus tenuis TaxID=1066 RepID=UPI0019077045|nr:HypC/HybG/HupF family hydrogenase formation chaperone [Rhodocyclus tenuis]MBK1679815.1 hydrogenase assembly protein HupF [Rhodocyclus tenuis]